MRSLVGVVAVALLMSSVVACGGVSKEASGSSRASVSSAVASSASGAMASGRKAEGDYDNDDGRRSADDDRPSLRSYGHEAARPDRPIISALVRRYYAAAAAGEGARACAMINSDLTKAVPLDYGQLGPAYLHGAKTCAAVLTLLFKHDHRQLEAEVPHLELAGVRVEGNNGFVLLRFGGKTPERQIMVGREGGVWKIQVLLDGEMRPVP